MLIIVFIFEWAFILMNLIHVISIYSLYIAMDFLKTF